VSIYPAFREAVDAMRELQGERGSVSRLKRRIMSVC
jgi:hypothetical protein